MTIINILTHLLNASKQNFILNPHRGFDYPVVWEVWDVAATVTATKRNISFIQSHRFVVPYMCLPLPVYDRCDLIAVKVASLVLRSLTGFAFWICFAVFHQMDQLLINV